MTTVSTARQVEIIKALAHPVRLEIVQSLSQGPRCVSDIVASFDCDMSTISKHLTLMRKAGWVSCEKKGLQVYYELACDCLPTFLTCIAAIDRGASDSCGC
ncbi:ArsR/SmtB family transcription factor [Roseibacillus ishigakijimensis]|uniref:Winged helix-turn-helix transcriptional regulator n=1 Tax=Roseibacillus ishigakijimensis TaxID=454146 RepID=A0A934RN43_9BACT|nr:metalloregulator ArsR/SmtB family transcription factor [Roseibacillus ishigakijimensis]MBK1834847.1 winged helix-turn-helix transcriptional regulator [Roseibacillus ishigakijimensis]